MKKYIDLFLAFAKIGVMTFGGGYAMLPMLERELIDNRGWTTNEELMDYFAVASARRALSPSIPRRLSAISCTVILAA